MPVNPIVINQNKDFEKTISIMDKNGIFMIPLVEDDVLRIGICARPGILKEILNERAKLIGKKNVTTTIGEG